MILVPLAVSALLTVARAQDDPVKLSDLRASFKAEAHERDERKKRERQAERRAQLTALLGRKASLQEQVAKKIDASGLAAASRDAYKARTADLFQRAQGLLDAQGEIEDQAFVSLLDDVWAHDAVAGIAAVAAKRDKERPSGWFSGWVDRNLRMDRGGGAGGEDALEKISRHRADYERAADLCARGAWKDAIKSVASVEGLSLDDAAAAVAKDGSSCEGSAGQEAQSCPAAKTALEIAASLTDNLPLMVAGTGSLGAAAAGRAAGASNPRNQGAVMNVRFVELRLSGAKDPK